MKSKTVVISFDFELGWGVLEEPYTWIQRQEQGIYTSLRTVIPELIALLDQHSIQTTWAVTGAMLESNKNNIKIEHLPESYQNSISSFLNKSNHYTWNGLDLIEVINKSKNVEIATHTYTHFYASHKDASKEAYLADVKASLDIIRDKTYKECDNIIFPRDQSEYFKYVFNELNLNCRLNPSLGMSQNTASRLLGGIKKAMTRPEQSRVYISPERQVLHFGSEYCNWVGGKYEGIKSYTLRKNLKSILNCEAKSNEVYHLWLHPFNLTQSEDLKNLIFNWLSDMGEAQERGEVKFKTMNDINNEIQMELQNV